ncbi:MAG TPA: hypothetical protein PLV61_13690 [Parvularculaceae bacterium]|nr:hypothetical protein [Amphiplicatus sp.]HOP20324.1 hypothetical protein [Amphiplicatus sp.]HPE32239.1 hypothetical protein [Parvularculaceae bacterium]
MGQARKTNGSSGEGLDEACAELLELTARLEERLELLHEESRRAAETLTRVKLAADNAKDVAKRQTKKLDEIAGRLEKIESLIAEGR